MGYDDYNPFTSEQHVKRVPFWQLVSGFIFAVAATLACGWGAAVLILSLERV